MLKYVLVTPAQNEEAFIAKTIESVVRQTHRPAKWVIVSDGSTDRTEEIVERYVADNPWIELLRMPPRTERDFSGKVRCFAAGASLFAGTEYELIGNLDGDVSFGEDYFEFLLGQFERDPSLGVAGTPFVEESGYSSATKSFEGYKHVAGACQLFRRECFEGIGGYKPVKAGGIDWVAVTTARMKGWTTRSFRERQLLHHRPIGTAGKSEITATFAHGVKDYFLGGHPVWQFCRVLFRMAQRPYVIGGFALGGGYLWATITRRERSVSRELMQFHRKEQMSKLALIVRKTFRFQAVDSFNLDVDDEQKARLAG